MGACLWRLRPPQRHGWQKWGQMPYSISESEFEMRWKAEGASSCRDAPSAPIFTCYSCDSNDFLERNVYPCWFTNPGRTEEVAYDSPEATPILFRDFALSNLRRPMCDEPRRQRPVPHVMVEHCAKTGVIVVKDGNKGLLAIARSGARRVLHVTQVSGDDWSRAKYDMKIILKAIEAGAVRRQTWIGGWH